MLAHLRRSLSYSGLMFAARITFPHFSVSRERSLPNSAGEPGSALLPSSAIRALIFGSTRAALISLLSVWIICNGVFLEVPKPTQKLAS